MISDRKRRPAATYQMGFNDALARCIEVASEHAETIGSANLAYLIDRMREISLEASHG